jgi:hypothetical protein
MGACSAGVVRLSGDFGSLASAIRRQRLYRRFEKHGFCYFCCWQSFLYRICGRNRAFGSEFPEWFGSLPASEYSVFQIMTLESWSMGIVWPVMDLYPGEAIRKLALFEKKLAERQ